MEDLNLILWDQLLFLPASQFNRILTSSFKGIGQWRKSLVGTLLSPQKTRVLSGTLRTPTSEKLTAWRKLQKADLPADTTHPILLSCSSHIARLIMRDAHVKAMPPRFSLPNIIFQTVPQRCLQDLCEISSCLLMYFPTVNGRAACCPNQTSETLQHHCH